MFVQLSLFDMLPKPRVGEYVVVHGTLLSWNDIRPGMTLIYDCSTQNHKWLKVTTVEKIIHTPDDWRVILDGGRNSRPLINKMYIDSGSVKLYGEVGA